MCACRFRLIIVCKGRSQWPRGLRRSSAAARLLRSWVWIPPWAWMFVCCACCVLSGRRLCHELITRPEESYRLWCVVVCDLETSWMRRPWPTGVCCAKRKKNIVCKGRHCLGTYSMLKVAVIRNSGPGLRICVLWQERIEILQFFFRENVTLISRRKLINFIWIFSMYFSMSVSEGKAWNIQNSSSVILKYCIRLPSSFHSWKVFLE